MRVLKVGPDPLAPGRQPRFSTHPQYTTIPRNVQRGACGAVRAPEAEAAGEGRRIAGRFLVEQLCARCPDALFLGFNIGHRGAFMGRFLNNGMR